MGVIISALIASTFAFAPMFAEAKTPKAAVNLTCMQTAVGVREDALATAFKGFSDDVMAALAARKAALNTAWGMSDGMARKAAIKSAWTAWKTAKKAAHTELKTDRKKAWDTFKTTAKNTCKEVTPKEEGLEKDTAGTVAL